MPNFTSDFAT